LIGFHTQYHCNHFLETVNNALESRVLWENFSVKMGGRTTFIKTVSDQHCIHTERFDIDLPKIKPSQLLTEYGLKAQFIGIGVDRIDYTKGIVEKISFC